MPANTSDPSASFPGTSPAGAAGRPPQDDTWWRGLPDRDRTALAPYSEALEEIEHRSAALADVDDQTLEELARQIAAKVRGGRSPSAALDGPLGGSPDEPPESVPSEDVVIEWFALVREVAARTIGERPYPPQILAGLALHDGKLAELATGEGKTLAAVAPVSLEALAGRGAHVLTFNDYLARRDAEWMGPVYRRLGLTVGYVVESMTTAERQRAYAADITYLTVKEAGFDLLRDGLAFDTADQVHRPFHFALVDEADSILIDEARIPLVIAGTYEETSADLGQLAEIAKTLEPGRHFDTDEGGRTVFLTEDGAHSVEKRLGCGNLFAPENMRRQAEMRNALHAEVLLARDVDYIVRNGAIELVDELTGRVADKRQWPDGLQAALEAKEQLQAQPEGQILSSITVQHLVERYPRLAAMTATARSAERELSETYDLSIVTVPTFKLSIRTDHADRIYTTKGAKDEALVAEIRTVHERGRPILVGTASVGESEQLAAQLEEDGIACRVLNAKNDAEEAEIVADAGAFGAVTISTNMAGRGTDIRLGGSDSSRHEKVAALGGLYVIGTNRHESRRIDEQLRGRAGRQGDPGSSRFIVSLEDELLRSCGIERLVPTKLLPASGTDAPLTHPAVQREVNRAQRIIEGLHGDIRSELLRYSHLIEGQRDHLQELRQEVLEGLDVSRLLEARSPERWRKVAEELGEKSVLEIERRITLLALDRHWREHLDFTRKVRDEIHLVRFDGKQPVVEFYRTAGEAYDAMLGEIDDEIVATFEELEIGRDGVDWESAGLKGPSATWTYLVEDSAGGENTFLTLATRPTLGIWAVLTCWWLLIPWAAVIHFRRWRARRRRGVEEAVPGDPGDRKP